MQNIYKENLIPKVTDQIEVIYMEKVHRKILNDYLKQKDVEIGTKEVFITQTNS